METNREKRGQFIIIAVLLAAIMIVSIGALMHSAVTYYKHEPWEEYSTLIGDIEINSRRLVELSLATYTNSFEPDKAILSSNLEKWQNDLDDIYPSSGIVLTSNLSNGGILDPIWNMPTSTSTASAKFTIEVSSIGLEGYSFEVVSSLRLTIVSSASLNDTNKEIIALVTSETGMPVPELGETNFRIENATILAVDPVYDAGNILEYRILHNGPLSPRVEVWDQRGIRVVGR